MSVANHTTKLAGLCANEEEPKSLITQWQHSTGWNAMHSDAGKEHRLGGLKLCINSLPVHNFRVEYYIFERRHVTMSKEQENKTQITTDQATTTREGAIITPDTLKSDTFIFSKSNQIGQIFGKDFDKLDVVEILVGGALIAKAPGKVKSYLLLPNDKTDKEAAQVMAQKMVNTIKMLMVQEYDTDQIMMKQGNRMLVIEVGDYKVPAIYGMDKLVSVNSRVYMNKMAKKADRRGFSYDILESVQVSDIYNEETGIYKDVLTAKEFEMYFENFCTQHKIEFDFKPVVKEAKLISDFGGFMNAGDDTRIYVVGDDYVNINRVEISAYGIKSLTDITPYYASTEAAEITEIVNFYFGNVSNVSGQDADANEEVQ